MSACTKKICEPFGYNQHQICQLHTGLQVELIDFKEYTKKSLDNNIHEHEKIRRENAAEHEKIEQTIDLLRNRLPAWAMLVISLLSTILGYLIALIKKGN